MMGARFGPKSLAILALVLGLSALTLPANAQTGQVKGKVVDADNKPVEGAIITIQMIEGMNRKYETKTDRRGQYVQIGIQPGKYKITASKDGMSQSFDTQIRLDGAEVNFELKPGSTGDLSPEERKKAEEKMNALRGAFEQGVALSQAGKHDEAIAKFNEVLAQAPKCAECYANIGAIQAQKKAYDEAEAAYKQAIEIAPNSVEAYNGLANVYNAQRKFDQAAEASAQAQKLAGASGGTAGAAGGGNASAVFNQGIIAWNAQKIPEARKLFEQTIQIDPKHADAHYWLGMSYVNEGKLQESAKYFEEYLKLAPEGQYAANAKGVLAAIKK
jgi:tetratricopeptide (TPR) repeat protein